MNINPCTCRWKKQHSAYGFGKTYVSYCGKVAVGISPNGGDDRALCQEHMNRVIKRNKLNSLRSTTGMSKYELKLKGLI